MKARKFSTVLFMLCSASMLTACASSTGQSITQTPDIPVHLLSPPAELPKVQRTGEGAQASMNGQQCFGSVMDLADIAGGIRGSFIELQQAVILSQSQAKGAAK